jgi:hypothetical protein
MTPYFVILVGFVGLLAAALALEILGRTGREPFRPLSRVLDVALSSRIARWSVWSGWLWIGFHFLAR